MLTWFENNAGTVAVSLILVAIVVLIVLKLVKDKKKGKSSCGCNCAHCALAGQCHKNKSKRNFQNSLHRF